MRTTILALLTGLLFCGVAMARPLPGGAGFIIFAEQRFDPAVQRLLAQRSLNALPLANGRLFFIVPAQNDTREQQDQIRYLEYLLDKSIPAGDSAAAPQSAPAADR